MRWKMWRPVVERILSYEEVKKMSHHELLEANAAIDIQFEKIKQARGGN
ncbi:DUF1322 family protein [Lysinibacillus antri]|uniref:DUF1322 domain-containing protein n=1 Tax=Lysinibacillus antri TaxID=2498145 RepID=A0A432LFM7_9BACI|nr:DUF1322 domain-containing protein [Lysinibacillus antri]